MANMDDGEPFKMLAAPLTPKHFFVAVNIVGKHVKTNKSIKM